jgi:hypothetical protein
VFEAEHLFVPLHDNDHYSLLIVNHDAKTVLVLDSDARLMAATLALVPRMLPLLNMVRTAVHAGPPYDYNQMHYINVNGTDPRVLRQIDDISCGPFVVAYAYWFAFHARSFPTVAHFPGANAHVFFRLVLIHLLHFTGAVSPPLAQLPPPQ